MGNRPNKDLPKIKEEFEKGTSIRKVSKMFNISASHLYNLRRDWEDEKYISK